MKVKVEDLTSLLKKSISILKGYEKTAPFSDAVELQEAAKAKKPDQQDYFEKGMELYRILENGDLDRDELVQAAVHFYVSYEEPPVRVRMAIVNLLRLSGDYTNACLYAYEFMKEEEIPAILFDSMPFIDRNGCLNLRHLLLTGWSAEVILAVITYQFSRFYEKAEERGKILETLIHSADEQNKSSEPLLLAVCAFLYVNVKARITDVQQKELDDFIAKASCEKVVEELLQRYGVSQSQEQYLHPYGRSDTWNERHKVFNRLYAGRERKGYFLYYPDRNHFFIWNTEPMIIHIYVMDDRSLYENLFNIDLDKHVILPVKYIDCEGENKRIQPMAYEVDLMRSEVHRVACLLRVQKDNELIAADEIFQAELIFEKAESFKTESFEKRFYLFNRYKWYRWHDRKIGKSMMLTLISELGEMIQPKQLVNFFYYHLFLKDYEGAVNFAEDNKEKLGEKYYAITQKQLKECRQTFLKGESASWQGNKMKRTTFKQLKGYNGFAAYFFQKGQQMLLNEDEDVRTENAEKLAGKALQMLEVGGYHQNQKSKAAEYYMKAGALLNERRKSYDYIDMDEIMFESMFYAFENLSYQGLTGSSCNYDVYRSYLEQALRQSKNLSPQFCDEQLGDTIEKALKRYFKPRMGHDNDTLEDAIKYMAQSATVSTKEFGDCLIRLSVYFPDILSGEFAQSWQYNPVIKEKLETYAKTIDMDVTNNVMEVLRKHRDIIVEEMNELEIFVEEDSDDMAIMENDIEKISIWMRKMKNSQNLYEVLSQTDRKYVDLFHDLLIKAQEKTIFENYRKTKDFQKECAELKRTLDKNPCSFAMDYLYEYIGRVLKYIECQQKNLYTEILPEISIEALFAEKNCEKEQMVNVYLRLECVGGKSDLRQIEISVFESEYAEGGTAQSLCKYLEKDRPEYCFIAVESKERLENCPQLKMEVEISCIIDATEERKTFYKNLSVPLDNLLLSENYEQMYNSGSALQVDSSMAKYTFYGRDLLLDQVCQIFYNFPKSIVVLYGQKRVGKTSVANYVADRMQKREYNFLVVNCGNSNANVLSGGRKNATDVVIADFYATVLQKLAETIKRDAERSEYLQEEIRALEEAEKIYRNSFERPMMSGLFQKVIFGLKQSFERVPSWRGTRILLWFDEFQQYYLYILAGVLQPEFMGFIKAFTEECDFSLLLVGCEPMIPFVQDVRFGNTFSAATQIYVDYLSKEFSEKLICEPIQKKSGRSNPLKYVVDEIYQYSAGSPFFIQLICQILIDELNEQKKVYANKQMIIDSLHKRKKVTFDKFNSLYDSLDKREGTASIDDNQKVLIQIALRQGQRVSSARENIIRDLEGKTEKLTTEIIAELLNRKVIEEIHGELRIVVRLYEAWLWENRFEMGQYEIRQ